jgi:hypothetical protein
MTLTDTRAALECVDRALEALADMPATEIGASDITHIMDELEKADARLTRKLRVRELEATQK